jgi:hypothetical protein
MKDFEERALKLLTRLDLCEPDQEFDTCAHALRDAYNQGIEDAVKIANEYGDKMSDRLREEIEYLLDAEGRPGGRASRANDAYHEEAELFKEMNNRISALKQGEK